jgi:hypothetical protein
MKKILLLNLLISLFTISKSQNLILNGDFETYSSCPTNLDEVNKANNWVSVINSPDYYNCNFIQHSAFPQALIGAYSGTGFMGFASYGDPNGSAEAIAQTFQQALLPGNNYTVRLAAKKANSGTWSNVCGGIAVYGIKGILPAALSSIHASQIAGSALLGTSPAISNDLWQTFTFNLTVADTVNHLVFTVEMAPGCTECIFLDSTALYITPNSIDEVSSETFFHVYPNPAKETLTVVLNRNEKIIVTNLLGETVIEKNFSVGTKEKIELDVTSLVSGIYLIKAGNAVQKFLKE